MTRACFISNRELWSADVLKILYTLVNFDIAGGRDTAGLGGKGGPYRLDSGHKVYQISQIEKDAVPDEVKRAAREMGEKAFKERCQLHPLEYYLMCCTSD